MIRRWPQKSVVQEVSLAEIDGVQVQNDSNSDFFRTGNLEVLSQGKVVMTLKGVKEPESFRNSIIQAYTAWVPGKIAFPFVPAKAASAT